MFLRRRAFFGAAFALIFVLAAQPSISQDIAYFDNFAIVNVHVIPMDSERLLNDQVVIVSNGLIQDVGSAADTEIPPGMPVIEGNGRYLMPGLADLHVHVLHEDELVNYLAWGVTTVMHLGGSGIPGREILELRNQISAGNTPGPNIYTTNRVFDGDPRLNDRSLELTDPESARQEVRNLKEGGFDFIKIYNNIAQPEFEATVDEARKVGLSVIGHVPRKFAALTALAGGQNAIAHTEELFFSYFEGPRSTADGMNKVYVPDMSKLKPLLDVMIANQVATMPDLSFTFTDLIMWDDLDLLWNDGDFPYLHPTVASMWQSGNINRRSNIENFVLREQWKYELMLDLTKSFQDAGILQVIGTDAAIPGLFPGKAAHRELTELVKAGISNFDALAIGTRNGGEFVRRFINEDVRFGQVLPGYRADLILLDENPLQDVRHVRSVSDVAVNGRFMLRASIDERRNQLKTRYKFLRSANDSVDAALAGNLAAADLRKIIGENAEDKEFLGGIEARVNAAGYAAAFADDLDRAKEILHLNTNLFPDSANTWDSLAEITLDMGDAQGALTLYQKALDADPDFSNAAKQIERIRADLGK